MKEFMREWYQEEERRNVKLVQALCKLDIYEQNDFEPLCDEVSKQIEISGREAFLKTHPEYVESYTNQDRGIKAFAVIDQWYDQGTNQDDINKAIEKVAIKISESGRREKRARNFINRCMARGYYGYLYLRKSIGKTLEHPIIHPWADTVLAKIPTLINPGGKVTLLEGSYNITGTINSASNMILEGQGWMNTILDLAANLSVINLSSKSNVILRDFQIDGNRASYQPSNKRIISGEPASYIEIDGIYIHDAIQYGIEIKGGSHIRTRNSWFKDFGKVGVWDGDPISYLNIEDVMVSNNYCYGCLHGGGADAMDIQDGSGYVIVSENYIENCARGIAINAHAAATIGNRQLCIGNTLKQITSDFGIMMGSENVGTNAEDIVIANNILYDMRNDTSRAPIDIVGITRPLIINNIIDVGVDANKAHYGIREREGTNYLVRGLIAGNVIRNCVDDGIKISRSSSSRLTIAHNRCYDCNYGIHIAEGDHIFVFQNEVNGNTTAGILVDSGKNPNGWIKDNPGYNPVGISAISVGASEFTHTAGSSPETIYIHSGTVSLIKKGTTTIFTDTGHSVELEPHELCKVTYSVAPTMYKDVH